ncbi:hypothetical protein Bca52824_039884 [Brassica carinata]|uniref:Uncharacterized protein n=1 Tax=Brassica carinata TaxID=52824 RepID=A0A8X7RUH1_BRACI|nr:hypothetical protein Bca52824_039884 [Brassica carinata]
MRDGFTKERRIQDVGLGGLITRLAYASVNRGGMKGCIEWPRGTHKNNVKTKLMEAQVEGQKVQLKHVLEHNI